jgi:hypothetical protein
VAETPATKNGQRKSAKVLIRSIDELDGEEKRELSYLGVALAQMPWLRLHSSSDTFREGVERGKGRVWSEPDSSLDAFDAVFTYRTDNPYQAKHHIDMTHYESLQAVVGEAVKRLYALGIIE